MNQYWIKVKQNISNDGAALWQLTPKKFQNEAAVYEAYKAEAKSLDYEILETKPHEQLELKLEE
mgnify:CR=1 FL=1|jgi:hypothetical protein